RVKERQGISHGTAAVLGEAVSLISLLMRRSLSFQTSELLAFLGYCAQSRHLYTSFTPIRPLTRALERFAAENPIEGELREEIQRFTSRLKSSDDREAQELSRRVALLCAGETSDLFAESPPETELQPAPHPAPAGNANILVRLKRHL